MAKANVVLPNGTKVEIDGTAEEVAQLLDKIAQQSSGSAPTQGRRKRKPGTSRSGIRSTLTKGGVKTLIAELVSEDYFKTKRSLSDIQKKLEERGHIYPITTISPCLTRMTKSRALRRMRENKVWVYVN